MIKATQPQWDSGLGIRYKQRLWAFVGCKEHKTIQEQLLREKQKDKSSER